MERFCLISLVDIRLKNKSRKLFQETDKKSKTKLCARSKNSAQKNGKFTNLNIFAFLRTLLDFCHKHPFKDV